MAQWHHVHVQTGGARPFCRGREHCRGGHLPGARAAHGPFATQRRHDGLHRLPCFGHKQGAQAADLERSRFIAANLLQPAPLPLSLHKELMIPSYTLAYVRCLLSAPPAGAASCTACCSMAMLHPWPWAFAFLASVLSALSTEIARCRARGDIRYGFSMGFSERVGLASCWRASCGLYGTVLCAMCDVTCVCDMRVTKP